MRRARPGEVADPVAVAVHVRLDVEAVDDRGLPPQVAGVGDLHDCPPQARQQLAPRPAAGTAPGPCRRGGGRRGRTRCAPARRSGRPARRHRRRRAPPLRISLVGRIARAPRRTSSGCSMSQHSGATPARCATDPSRWRGPRHPSARARRAPAAPRGPGRRCRGIVHDRAQRVGGLRHGREAVGPARDPARGLGADGGAEQRRRRSGPAPDARVDAPRTCPSCDTRSPARRRRMMSTLSSSRALRSSLDGQGSPVTCSFIASPLPSAAQNRPGNISSSVAIACAMITG